MADQRTMAELLQAPTKGYGDAIVILAILAENFELKHGLLNLVTSKQFYGFEKEDPHAHIRWFNKITSTIKYRDVPNSSIKLMLFPFSIERAARIWLEKEPPRSILTWEDLVSKFINQFFPPSKTTNLRNEITNFQQRFDESFCEAWDRFKNLFRACPHHGFTELHQLDTFYNALILTDQDSLNLPLRCNLLTKTPRDALTIIENKSKVRNSWNKPILLLCEGGHDSHMPIESPMSLASHDGNIVNALIDSHDSLRSTYPIPVPRTYSHSDERSEQSVAPLTIDLLICIPPMEEGLERCEPERYHRRPLIAIIASSIPLSHLKQDPTNKKLTRNRMTVESVASKILKSLRRLHFELSFAEMLFYMCFGQTSRYSYNDAVSINRIDVIDVACEEYAQEVLGFSDSSTSGNPTLSLDPILSTSSPSLTHFKGGDFILEEIKACLANNSIPPGINDADFDPEGDLLLLEKLLNDDPSSPLPSKELHVEELKIVKSSIDDPPELELKDLPSHLEYDFLEGTDKLLVIIAKNLKEDEKVRLLKVLKSHKCAIACKISDIKGIDLNICTASKYLIVIDSNRQFNIKKG
ncbi:reverse transcriptase domain-containing protein [Tanacetum coccineum]